MFTTQAKHIYWIRQFHEYLSYDSKINDKKKLIELSILFCSYSPFHLYSSLEIWKKKKKNLMFEMFEFLPQNLTKQTRMFM